MRVNASSRFVQITGRTIRIVMKVGTFAEPIQISARMIKDATGVALITVIMGKIASRNSEIREVMIANILPPSVAMRMPDRTLHSDLAVIR